MKVKITSSDLVQPAEPTPSGKIPLSELDQVVPNYYVHIIHLYNPPNDCSLQSDAIFDVWTSSLTKVLVQFYPLAGRLSPAAGGRLDIECNGKGCRLIVAEADAALDELQESGHDHLVPAVDVATPLPELPLLVAQLTRFLCGGVCLGVAMTHCVVDGRSAAHFYAEWARIARREPFQRQPIFSRGCFVEGQARTSAAPRPQPPEFDTPPLLIGSSCQNEKKKATARATLQLTKLMVETLKKKANEGGGAPKSHFSRFVAIAAHIWRCACKARGHKPEQRTMLNTSVNVQRRIEPPVPETYFGNAILFMAGFDCSGDLISKRLSYAASKVQETIDRATGNYVKDTIDFIRGFDDLQSLHDSTSITEDGNFFGNPNLGITSWLNVQFDGLDFGWGKEVMMTTAHMEYDGDFLILPGYDPTGGSIAVVLCLQEAHMEVFKKIFYEDV